MTHDIEHCSKMIKLPKDKIVEVSYAFLSMPSFATDVSKDPTGAMLINYNGEKDGEEIYCRMNRVFSALLNDEKVGKYVSNHEVMRDIGKLDIFCPIKNFKISQNNI